MGSVRGHYGCKAMGLAVVDFVALLQCIELCNRGTGDDTGGYYYWQWPH